MPLYVWISLAGATALALGSLTGKALARYRICSAGLITWGQGLATATLAGAVCALFRIPFPSTHTVHIVCLSATVLLATWLLNHALQEGDASTVVPLLGLKIPMTALLAHFFLGETASPRVWLAVLCAGLAVAAFGSGSQRRSEGGHGYLPIIPITMVILAALSYSVSDLIAKHAMNDLSPVTVLLWSNVLLAPAAAAMLARKHYRQYSIGALDIGLFALRGSLVLAAILGLYVSFSLAGGVIIPNVLFGARGFTALAASYALNKTLNVPMERQSGLVYATRAVGTALLFVAVFLALSA